MKKLLMACLLAAGCTNEQGCTTAQTQQENQGGGQSAETVEAKTNGPVAYLCVGMETSARFGACPGCALDASRMDSLLKGSYGYKGDILVSSQATKAAVASKLRAGIEATPENGLFLFCYSGHGGQEKLGGQEPTGADSKDEYLCLYDTYMLDDEIWAIVSKCRGRVFLYFDACHSATMYRSVASDAKAKKGMAVALAADDLIWTSGFTFNVRDYAQARALDADGSPRASVPNILCWSGCKEAEYSYGSDRGGVMTSNLIKYWRNGVSYDGLWKSVVKGVKREQPTQHPIQTQIGSLFDVKKEAFR